MPVHPAGKNCYQWGSQKIYCGPGAYQKAERQGRAAFAHGYRGQEMKETSEMKATLLETLDRTMKHHRHHDIEAARRVRRTHPKLPQRVDPNAQIVPIDSLNLPYTNDYENGFREMHWWDPHRAPNEPEEVNWRKVHQYVKISKKLPVEVVRLGGNLYLVDGYHRYAANKLAGNDEILVLVVPLSELPPHRYRALPFFPRTVAWFRRDAREEMSESHAVREVTFHHGERLRIRTKGPQGQPFESFWYTVDTQGMSLTDVALQFAQTGQPGMFIEIVSGKLKWTFQQGKHAGQPSVTLVSNVGRRVNREP